MEKNKSTNIYIRTIEGIEQIIFVVILRENRFSFYCLREFEWEERLLKPFVEDIPFRQFDAVLDLYETAVMRRTEGLWTVVQHSLTKSLLRPSPREEKAIEKKLYYERGFFPCLSPEDERILKAIKKLKDKGR